MNARADLGVDLTLFETGIMTFRLTCSTRFEVAPKVPSAT